MTSNISSHCEWFKNYAREMCALEQADKSPMQLKLEHSLSVLNLTGHILADERPSPDLQRACLLAALYHDLGRFRQYLDFHTFKDRESCNHALLSLKVLREKQCLDPEKKPVEKIARSAIILHNRFRLPQNLPREIEFAAWIIRDADKLDILRIMDAHLADSGGYNPTVVLSLPDKQDSGSSKVIEDALNGRVAAYADLQSVNDFRVLLGTWFYDLHFPASRRKFLSDSHIWRIIEDLPENKIYSQARQKLLRDFTSATA